ncbi:MAG: response regulator [Candidatus Cloacimonetes bacterium]|nr:response regulator [Candidatus Cloacimonadota bacterium]MCF7814375.1 response regulator [Candidatus Cloacimonadota bacterium]MCF7868998.1 response regulator [Candidatus Cloacimonadota bacterium]MCF7884392.1 response regulator [Candidatus Cloacimonadota bacterium]
MSNKKKILIVEDETIIALSLKHDLESLGFQLLTPVSTGEEAVCIICEECPDLVLLDIRLAGEMTGLDVAKSDKCQDISKFIIFMTGYVTPEIKAEALKLNPIGFLEKPVEVEDILDLLQKIS